MDNTTFESIKISLASPETIRKWSYGEVKKAETINYRTLKPEKDGLFCERIFGPQKDWECACGRSKRIKDKGKKCEHCGVEITRAKVRRERMGSIELAAPVSHIWYFKGIPSRMGLILDITPRNLERVLYFACYIVIDPGTTDLKKCQILDEKDYEDYKLAYGDDFRADMGAEAIKELLTEVDLDALSVSLRSEIADSTGQKRAKALKRLDVVEAFRKSGNRPEWMILDVVPVIPPELRPMVQLEGGRFATSDLNDLYRRVINRNTRLKELLDLGAPSIMVRNEKRMLQEAVDALIDNGRRGRPVTGPNNRPLKSLSDMLKGKQGRFRQNLLGKRVDYSGRSVIVVGPELKIYQCGLPKEMALELFKPFVMKRLVQTGKANNVKSAKKMVERQNPLVWDALEVVIKDHPVLLNRAPTLHRLGIQAFEPVLVEGRAIKLHPLACTAFNADFDGDQMAVHVPLSSEAQAEARFLMLAANNLLKPSDGCPVTVPTQDMILGSYYLTLEKNGEPGEGMIFRDVDEATMAYDQDLITLQSKIKIRMSKEIDGKTVSKIIDTTLGRVIFNRPIPQDLGYVDRSNPDNEFELEINGLVKKKASKPGEIALGDIINRCIKIHGTSVAAQMLDVIKAQGYKYSTRSGITVAVCDATVPPTKGQIVSEAEKQVSEVMKYYELGEYSDEERSKQVIDIWEKCTKHVADELKNNFDPYNPINMMLDSGARGNESQLRQLAGMRGLIANTAGKTIEVPIKANYREGLDILEYFIASRGARKGLADTALRTADSGYLTRRLVDVSQDVIIREEDCGCTEGTYVYDIFDKNDLLDGKKSEEDKKKEESKRLLVSLEERLAGRFLLEDFVDKETGELVMSKDKMMSEADAKRVAKFVRRDHAEAVERGEAEEGSLAKVQIRSILTCQSEHGVCIKCYGANLATGEPVTVGEAVGIIAAQSIGEPGTQLTMRTFHTGGARDAADITTGLPRVEELFEARKPKHLALISRSAGIVSEEEVKRVLNIVVTDEDGVKEFYPIHFGMKALVHSGDHVEKGQMITEGSPSPHDILEVLGVDAVHDYLIREVQKTYRTQGVDVSDKHIEVIVRQMMKKIKITEPGNTSFLPGEIVDKLEFRSENAQVQKEAEEAKLALLENTDLSDEERAELEDKAESETAKCAPVLMGITKASLATESFLSAASFQETTRVLTDAAIKGKTDHLLGLKENVIIGKLLPSGTGMKCYSDVQIVSKEDGSEDDSNAESALESQMDAITVSDN